MYKIVVSLFGSFSSSDHVRGIPTMEEARILLKKYESGDVYEIWRIEPENDIKYIRDTKINQIIK